MYANCIQLVLMGIPLAAWFLHVMFVERKRYEKLRRWAVDLRLLFGRSASMETNNTNNTDWVIPNSIGGRKSVRVVDGSVSVKLRDVLCRISDKIKVNHSRELLPSGCKFVINSPASSFYLIEQPPTVRRVFVSTLGDSHKSSFAIGLPYVCFVLGVTGETGETGEPDFQYLGSCFCSVFFADRPITDIDTHEGHISMLPNTNREGSVCLGSMAYEDRDALRVSRSGYAETMINKFWSSPFNGDWNEDGSLLIADRWGLFSQPRYNDLESQLESDNSEQVKLRTLINKMVLAEWEQRTLANPYFILDDPAWFDSDSVKDRVNIMSLLERASTTFNDRGDSPLLSIPLIRRVVREIAEEERGRGLDERGIEEIVRELVAQ